MTPATAELGIVVRIKREKYLKGDEVERPLKPQPHESINFLNVNCQPVDQLQESEDVERETGNVVITT